MTSVSQGTSSTDMPGDRASVSIGPTVERRLPAFQLRESKLRPLAPRLGLVRRSGMLDRAHDHARVTLLVAPAGYGKTTVLTQWANDHPGRVAWLAADDADNDPTVLCTYLAAALDRIESLPPEVFGALSSHRPVPELLTQLLAALEVMTEPVTLVIDQLESIANPECLDLIGGIASQLPQEVGLVLSSRVHPRLPIARLRVEGRLLELGTEDLALDHDAATLLLVGAGLDPAGVDVPRLVERTEGWPAGLYPGHARHAARRTETKYAEVLRGDSRFLGDYLQRRDPRSAAGSGGHVPDSDLRARHPRRAVV